MVEASQSALRVILLVTFTLLFAGLWANDQPNQLLVQKQPARSHVVVAEQTDSLVVEPGELVETSSNVGMTLPELEDVPTETASITLNISIETDGLTLSDDEVKEHVRQLPLGIADGDYMMVDPHGGVGWVRVRGNRQFDQGETLLTTTIGEKHVRYIRVTPTNIAIEAIKTVR